MSHPDNFAGLLDWPTYGPRDPEIARLVEEMAAEGMRLEEIELVIKQALWDRLAKLQARRAEPTS